jgi:hypothetical protein
VNAAGGLSVWIEGIGAWTPGLPDWPGLRAMLRDDVPVGQGDGVASSSRPTPQILPPGERRRAPTSVLIAVEAASQAVAMSGRDASTLACVFASAHGDASIMDYMCETLARAPRELSPTRFHNSVHNAAAGYWTIANGCHAASSAVSALGQSFGASLLEATVQACADHCPVLLVASDVPGAGPLGEMVASTLPFGSALVLAPARTAAACARLDLRLRGGAAATPARHPRASALAAANLAAHGLPLLEALAHGVAVTVTLPAAAELGLEVHMEVET